MAHGVLLAAAAALALAPGASAGPSGDAARAKAGLSRAVASGAVAELDAASYRAAVDEALAALRSLPPARAAALAGSLRTVAAHAGQLDRARALTLFEQLRFSTAFLRRHDPPPRGRDVRDADGVVYRSFGPAGLQFHPLASFGKLNAEVSAGRDAAGVRLAYALAARGRTQGAAHVWETFVRTSGGDPPWTSGLTQATAAQALARVGFLSEARRAYAAIPDALLLRTAHGPWIRLYHFNRDLVLNAQLQSAISLAEYGRVAGDDRAVRLAAGMRTSAARLLPRFHTGDWSLYALGGDGSSVSYHGYVASLLWKLAARTGNPFWSTWAARFRDDWRLPPRIEPGPPSPVAIPVPADGHRDEAVVRFTLSKAAAVTLRIAGEERRASLPAGAHQLRWAPGSRPPGEYDVRLEAVDRAGNRSERRLAPVRVARDNEPPELGLEVSAGRVAWKATDRGTPWLELRLELWRGGAKRVERLGRFPLAGETDLPLPPHRTYARLVALDSAGNRTARGLGSFGALGALPE